MMDPEVSILMPFRDAGATIGEAVASLLGQRGVAFEILAVDDGSRDGSRGMVAGLRDPRLRLISNPGPAGIVGALEAGRAAARGPWIARMDADDLAAPERLAVSLRRARESPGLSGVACGVRLVNPCGRGMERYVAWVNQLRGPRQIATARFIECPLIHPSVMVKSEALAAVGGYREMPWAEDHDLWLRMLEAGHRFGKAPEVLLGWRDSPWRLTRIDPRYGDEARMAMRCHYLARLPAVAAGGVSIAGAGPIGKRLARGLLGLGVRVYGFFEVNARRIGQRIHGAAVVGSGEAGTRWPETVLLGAVGVAGGRERVRQLAEAAGRVEGKDFWSVC